MIEILIQIVLFLIFLIFVIESIKIYNKIKYFENEIEYLEGKMKIPIQKKIDLIPELIRITKKNTEFERKSLREIAMMRSSWAKSPTMANATKISSAINALVYNVKERYPKLASSKGFMNISKQLLYIENRIEKIRYSYNGQISNYNKAISLFPGSIIAKLCGFKRKPFFGSKKK